jgi:hypothetical protein
MTKQDGHEKKAARCVTSAAGVPDLVDVRQQTSRGAHLNIHVKSLDLIR